MAEAKTKTKTKTRSKSKSKHSSPRLYEQIDLTTIMPWSVAGAWPHRPKSEIVRELRRLHTLPVRVMDDDDGELPLAASEGPTSSAEAATAISATSGTEAREEKPSLALPVRTLHQLDGLRLTRHRIELLLHCPSFEQVVRNCFVRVNVNPADVLPEYRIAEIVDSSELHEGYYVGKTATNIVLHLRYEDLVVRHELNDISNMAFTSDEFAYWHDNCICQAFEWPTTDQVSQKKLEIYNALNSESKVAAMLKVNGMLQLSMPMRPTPKGNLLERFGGGVYPWKLQRPPPPPPPTLPLLAAVSDFDPNASVKPSGKLDTSIPLPLPSGRAD